MVEEIVHLKLNDNAASTAVRNEVSGSVQGVSSVNTSTLSTTGKIARGFIFDGVSQKVTFTSPGWFANENVQTICLWFNSPKSSTVCRLLSHPATTNNNRVYISRAADDDINVTVGGTSADVVPAANWVADTWNHIILERNASKDTMSVWFNNVAVLTDQSVNVGNANESSSVLLATIGGSSEWYNGTLDDIRIYNRALTSTERDFIYNSGNGTEASLPIPSYVTVGTGSSKSRFIKTKWPITEGLTAGTTKTDENELFLKPEEGSNVLDEEKDGIY